MLVSVRNIDHIDCLGAPNSVAELWGVCDGVTDAHERASEWMEKHVLGALCEDVDAMNRQKCTNQLHFPAQYHRTVPHFAPHTQS